LYKSGVGYLSGCAGARILRTSYTSRCYRGLTR